MSDATLTEWQEDETLAMMMILSFQDITISGMDIKYADHVEYSKLAHGKELPPEDDDVMFIVTPASSWNAIQKALQSLNIAIDDQRQLKMGRAFKIPISSVAMRHFPEHVRIALKLTIGIDHYRAAGTDFIDTVRWTRHTLNPETHPFVVITKQCWNYFHRTIDRLGIREQLRSSRPLAVVMRKKDVFRITHEKFEKMR